MVRLAVNGVGLNVEQDGNGFPLLMLHGFTGSIATWDTVAPEFAAVARTIRVDLIGHGESDAPADPERYQMRLCVDDLIGVLDQLGVDRADVLGYSMGGRVALHVAAAAPDRVRRLVLESASPGLADATERDARVAADEALATRIERDGVDSFVEYWERLPLFASQAKLPDAVRDALRRQRSKNRVTGLANSLRGMGTGRQPPLWHRLADVALPTLLIVGELDAKYREIADQMARQLPNARVVVVQDAGHAVHLERPEPFTTTVLDFLTS